MLKKDATDAVLLYRHQ